LTREFDDPKPKWKKKVNVFHFIERVPCPYCPPESRMFPTNLSLARHILTEHNWDKSKQRIALAREHLLELIRKHLGSKNPTYPDDTHTVKRFEALADEITEAYA